MRVKVLTFVFLMVVLGMGNVGLAQEGLGNPKRGEEVYRLSCVNCHGDHGDGNGADSTTREYF